MVFNWVDGLHAGSPPPKSNLSKTESNLVPQTTSFKWMFGDFQPLFIQRFGSPSNSNDHETNRNNNLSAQWLGRNSSGLFYPNMAHWPTFTGGCSQLQTTLIPSYSFIEGTWWGNS